MSAPDQYEMTGPLRVEDPSLPKVEGRPMDHKAQPKKKDRGPIPARQANGYYADHATGDRLRSVTTILSGGVPKPALMFWSASGLLSGFHVAGFWAALLGSLIYSALGLIIDAALSKTMA